MRDRRTGTGPEFPCPRLGRTLRSCQSLELPPVPRPCGGLSAEVTTYRHLADRVGGEDGVFLKRGNGDIFIKCTEEVYLLKRQCIQMKGGGGDGDVPPGYPSRSGYSSTHRQQGTPLPPPGPSQDIPFSFLSTCHQQQDSICTRVRSAGRVP